MLVLAAAASAGGFFGWRAWQDHQFRTVPPEDPGREIVFSVEPGQVFWTVAKNLKAEGAVSDARRFVLLAQEAGKTQSVRAGDFLLSTGWTPDRVLQELTTTAGIMNRVQVREGLTWWKTAELVDEAGLGSFDSFAKAVTDPALLKAHNIPADSAEGYLFPETYYLTPPKDHDARPMALAMLEQFARTADRLWPEAKPSPTEMHRIVTIASLVEKETGAPEERPRIAGVIHNRLRRGMLLQIDPTIIYGLGKDFDGNLKRSHLTDGDNPYNTYVRTGLPPGPICSPGYDSLHAALHPETHKYLYFVAKGDGTHHFSKSLKEHNEAVVRYQLKRNQKTYRSTKSE